MAVYYPAFDVFRINAAGFRVSLPATTVNVYNVTAGASLGTLVSDANGIIAEGSFSATAGDVIEISHATYPLTCRFVLTATQDEAYTSADNNVAAYLAENLNVSTTNADTAALLIEDLGNSSVKPIRLSDVKLGDNFIPLQSSVPKTYRLSILPQDEYLQTPGVDLSTAESVDISIPASGSRTLFDHFTDATTSGTSEETLYIDQIDAGTLYTNGDKIVAEYAGIFAANANEKNVNIYFGGSLLFATSGPTENGTEWRLTLTLIRASSSAARYVVQFSSNVHWKPEYGDLTSKDFDATDYDIELKAETPDLAGDVTAKMGHGLFFPSAATNTGYLTWDGEILTWDGDELTW